MLLERLDIDVYRARRRVTIGPLQPRLNAVLVPDSFRQTDVVSFVRGVMLGGKDWARSSAGRVLWADSEGLISCRRDPDLSRDGRLTSERIGRHGSPTPYAAPQPREAMHRELSPELIDAVIVPEGHPHDIARRALAVARAAGFDVEDRERLHPTATRWHRRLAELENEMRSAAGRDVDTKSLTARRDELNDRLRYEHARPATVSHGEDSDAANLWRLRSFEDEEHRLRLQADDLRREIERVEAELRQQRRQPGTQQGQVRLTNKQRASLKQFDGQLMRWRRTLREIKETRQQLEAAQSDYDRRTHAATTDPRVALRHAEMRMEQVRRHVDWMIDNYSRGDGAAADLDSVADAQLNDAFSKLGESLKQICHSLADQETTGRLHRYTNQLEQLNRCESELLCAIDGLIARRSELLRQIARDNQVTFDRLTESFGLWYDNFDHPHLSEWLLSDACPPQAFDADLQAARWRQLTEDHFALSQQLADTEREQADCQREIDLLRSAGNNAPPFEYDSTERRLWEDELASIERQLSAANEFAAMQREADAIRNRLAGGIPTAARRGSVLTAADKWLARLTAGRLQSVDFVLDDYAVAVDRFRTDAVQGVSDRTIESLEHDWTLASIAIRLATVEAFHATGQPIAIVVNIDGPLVRYGSTHLRRNPVADALCRFGSEGHQLIIVTDRRRLADQIAVAGGRVHVIDGATAERTAPEHDFRDYDYGDIEPYVERPLFSQNLELVNRDLDTAWRETYGLYDSSRDGRFGRGRNGRDQQGPYYLTEQSGVDQAPSVDSVAAARLRGLSIATIGSLLASDAERLASRLGLVDVTGREVRRWQAEARLVCSVPRLRPFDAKVIVGCGVFTAQELRGIEPAILFRRVGTFLATARGKQVLRSGTSYELARITNWIVTGGKSPAGAFASLRKPAAQSTSTPVNGHRVGTLAADRANRFAAAAPVERESFAAESSQTAHANKSNENGVRELRFYLQLNSPVVDAPSIGPKMSARLETIGIETVEDLLESDPNDVAELLDHRRVDADTVEAWQSQATLVCRVPELRGHDAQLLVKAGIHSPEEMLEYSEDDLLHHVCEIANSSEGQRILRGSACPDRDEVHDWLTWAERARTLLAA